MMSGSVPETRNVTTNRIIALGKRPGIVPLLLLIAGALVPLPVSQHGSAHLLGIPTLCPFRLLTGLPCPGCGMTRAVCCCCHGQFGMAMDYHPLGGLFFAGLIIVAGYGIVTRRSMPERVVTPAAIIGIVLLIGIWGARLLHWLPSPAL